MFMHIPCIPLSAACTLSCHIEADSAFSVTQTPLQVPNMKQSAEVPVHCNALVKNLLDHVAQQYGFPTKQQIINNAP